ncbi:right-handed parallel beta-helix repeat-containing protein [Termitidicoccus mucosus]|uniref:right-handed parallel beta-helix repeat-containing protein n=1 Tax=Termitidicoccus mucosus TaxID=1184151 RepID=UPI002FEE1E56
MLLASAAPLPVVGAAAGRPVVYPAHNQAGIVQQPSFTWEPEPGAAAYEIEIAADYDYKKIAVPVTRVETPRFVPLQPLYPATRFWRTRAIAADGNAGKWSDTRVYKLHAPANKINIPANATLAEIRAAIAAAPASSLITFAPKAAYRLKLPQGDTHFLTLEKRDDLIIDGNDSLFIIESPSAGAVSLRDCRRVTLRRFRFDYDPLPHSIGTVVSVNITNDTAGAAAPPIENRKSKIENFPTVTLRRLPGYPDFDAPHMLANWGWGVILDPVIPGRMKAGSPLVVNFPGAKVTRNPAGADLFDVGISSANHAKFFAKGDRVIIFARAHSNAFCTADAGCGDITLDRIVTHAAPGLQFVGIGSTDFKLLSCASVPRDATRFFAGNADGVHVRANLLGPWIEGCAFNGIGDDGVALYNKGMAIGARPAPDTLAVAGTFMHLQPGDTFVIFNPFDGQLLGAPRTVTTVRPAGEKAVGGASGHWQQSAARADEASAGRAPATAGSWDVTFTPALETGDAGFPMGDATWWKNAQLFNRTRVNAGFVVKNNTFTSIRRYGVIARATDGVITGNTITGSSNSGITLLNEPNFWANGLHSERVLIARNKISATAFDASSSASGGVAVNLRSLYDHSADFRPKDGPIPKPARLHRAIRIEDNTIADWNHRAIFLRSAADCVIKGNIIAASPGAKFLDPDSDNIAILVDNTRDCVIAGNDTAGDPRLASAGRRLVILDSDNTAADGQVTSGK